MHGVIKAVKLKFCTGTPAESNYALKSQLELLSCYREKKMGIPHIANHKSDSFSV